jgi:hypothetical protein
MTKEEACRQIEKELATAREAEKSGNAGMARVCARRAAGIAIGFWRQEHPRWGWGVDAMSQLRAVQTDDALPPTVRDAATRLTTKAMQQFTSPSTHPVDDCTIIINYFLENT